jgi:hypothetical protein
VQVQQRRSPRPRFRGRLHEIAFFVSIPAGIALVDAGHRAAAYCLSLLPPCSACWSRVFVGLALGSRVVMYQLRRAAVRQRRRRPLIA